jgi:hypothetical protein
VFNQNKTGIRKKSAILGNLMWANEIIDKKSKTHILSEFSEKLINRF